MEKSKPTHLKAELVAKRDKMIFEEYLRFRKYKSSLYD